MELEQYQQFYEVDCSHWWFVARRKVIGALLSHYLANQATTLSIMDIGSGTGGMIPVLSQFGQVTSTEPNDLAFRMLQERYLPLYPDIEFLHGSWEAFSLPEASFDVITAFDVLEHCEFDLAALQHWEKWLKPGGLFILTVPAFKSLWGINDEVSHHYRRYDAKTLQAVISKTGLHTLKMSYMNHLMFLPVWLSRNIKDRLQKNQLKTDETLVTEDFKMPPFPFNPLLTLSFAWEQYWLPHGSLPWGTSLVAVLQSEKTRLP